MDKFSTTLKLGILGCMSSFLLCNVDATAQAQPAQVTECRDDNRDPQDMPEGEVLNCYNTLITYSKQRGYIESDHSKLPEIFNIVHGQMWGSVQICGENEYEPGDGLAGGCPDIQCANVVKSVGRHFKGNLISVWASKLSDSGEQLLGRHATVFIRVSRISIPDHCPIRGTDIQIRDAISRVIDEEKYQCWDWPGSGLCSFRERTLAFQDVYALRFQGETLPLLREMLRNE